MTTKKKNRVLAIDDEPAMIEWLKILLEHEGYEVRTAMIGTRGEEIFKTWKPDVVVTKLVELELSGKATWILPDLTAENLATVPGEIVVEGSTFLCLGLEWHIEGDANRNCAVKVAYRRKGDEAWTQGYPFLRCDPRPHPVYSVVPGNLLAGSIFNLEPDTEYEVKLSLSDPDGGMPGGFNTAAPASQRGPCGRGRPV